MAHTIFTKLKAEITHSLQTLKTDVYNTFHSKTFYLLNIKHYSLKLQPFILNILFVHLPKYKLKIGKTFSFPTKPGKQWLLVANNSKGSYLIRKADHNSKLKCTVTFCRILACLNSLRCKLEMMSDPVRGALH